MHGYEKGSRVSAGIARDDRIMIDGELVTIARRHKTGWPICHPYAIALENMPCGLRTYSCKSAMAVRAPTRMNGPSGRWLVRFALCAAMRATP